MPKPIPVLERSNLSTEGGCNYYYQSIAVLINKNLLSAIPNITE
jgi:hypothetical protein